MEEKEKEEAEAEEEEESARTWEVRRKEARNHGQKRGSRQKSKRVSVVFVCVCLL